jgi:Winged helix-turn helix
MGGSWTTRHSNRFEYVLSGRSSVALDLSICRWFWGLLVPLYSGGWRGTERVAWRFSRRRPYPAGRKNSLDLSYARSTRFLWAMTPCQLSFEFALWAMKMVRELIRREFNVRLSVMSVGRRLRKLGLSPQRPLWRSYQQNRVAVERWKSEEYPAIRAEAAAVGAIIYLGDEAECALTSMPAPPWRQSGRLRSYAPPAPATRSTSSLH